MAPYPLRKRKAFSTEMAAGDEQQLQPQTEKAEALRNPIVFAPPPSPPLRLLVDIPAHETLLRRLGLWEFVNLDFDEPVREDLIKELLVSFEYLPRKFTGESHVKGVSVGFDRAAVVNALRLPAERASKGGTFLVTKEESSFLDGLISRFMVFGAEDGSSQLSGFVEGLEQMRLVKHDWAGLIWFMMQKELLKGKRNRLVECYYASHMQMVLKHQKPELFDDDRHGDEMVGSSNENSDPGKLDDSMEDAAKILLHLQYVHNDLRSSDEVPGKRGQYQAPLTQHDSIVFQLPPQQLLGISAHRSLLTCLGLWEFANLGFDETIREDLIKELMISYDFNTRESWVNGVSISLDRTAVVNAFHLPMERFVQGGNFPISEEEGLFLKQLFWRHLVLKDDPEDASMMSLMSQTYVLGFAEILKNMRFEEADWAGLLWFMMECELLKGKRKILGKCYYASHLQLVLKHQKPELFDDDQEVGSTDEDCEMQSVGDSDENDEQCADLDAREFGVDAQVMEGGNPDGVCQSVTVDLLENETNLNAEANKAAINNAPKAHEAACDTGTISASKVHCPEEMHINLNAEIHASENEDKLMQNEANKAACDTSTDDFMMLDECNEAVCDIRSINANKVREVACDTVTIYAPKMHDAACDTGIINGRTGIVGVPKAPEAAYYTGTLKVPCMTEYSMVVDEGKEVCKTSTDNALKVPCLKDDYVVQYEGSEAQTCKSADDAMETVEISDNVADVSCAELDCQEVHMNCTADLTKKEIESVASVDLLVTLEAQDSGIKKEGSCSSDGVDNQELENQQKRVSIIENKHQDYQEAYMNNVVVDNAGIESEIGTFDPLITQQEFTDALDNQEIENHPSHLSSCQENNKLSLEISDDEEKQCLKKVNITDEVTDLEIYHSGGTQLAQKLHEVQNDGEKYEVVANRGTDHSLQTQQDVDKYEDKCVAEGFVLQRCTTADQSFVVPSSYTSVEEAPSSVHGNVVGSDSRNHLSLGYFGSENDIGLSLDGFNFGANVQSGHAAETSMMIGAREDFMDLDLCAEKVKIWAGRFMNSAKRKVEENQSSNLMLQKKIDEQNQIIQQYEFMLQKEEQQKQQYDVMLQEERQQRQISERRYERELYLMHNALEDYRKASKKTNAEFAKYRERVQLPEEPLYMPHPDGGDNVILVSEWKKLEEERQKMAFKTKMDDFEVVWRAYLDEELSVLNQYCARLEDLEHKVKTMSGSM